MGEGGGGGGGTDEPVQHLERRRAMLVRVIPVRAFGLVIADGIEVVIVGADRDRAARAMGRVGGSLRAERQQLQPDEVLVRLRRVVRAVDMKVGGVVAVEAVRRCATGVGAQRWTTLLEQRVTCVVGR